MCVTAGVGLGDVGLRIARSYSWLLTIAPTQHTLVAFFIGSHSIHPPPPLLNQLTGSIVPVPARGRGGVRGGVGPGPGKARARGLPERHADRVLPETHPVGAARARGAPLPLLQHLFLREAGGARGARAGAGGAQGPTQGAAVPPLLPGGAELEQSPHVDQGEAVAQNGLVIEWVEGVVNRLGHIAGMRVGTRTSRARLCTTLWDGASGQLKFWKHFPPKPCFKYSKLCRLPYTMTRMSTSSKRTISLCRCTTPRTGA